MKIKKLLLVMALAGSSLNQASAQNASSTPAARHVGDGVRSVGDTNRYVEMPEDTRPKAFKPKASLVSNSQMLDMEMLAPSASGDCGCGSGSCGSGGCNSGCGSAGLISGCGDKSTEYWLNMESLLWFGQRRQSPALITSANQGVLPVAGAPGVTTEFGGGDGLNSGLLTGYSLSGGKYLDSCQKIAVGGRVFGIFQNSQTRTLASDGSRSVGIPFYNSSPAVNAEDAYLVAFNTGVPVSAGTVTARADLNMLGAEASGYFLLGRSSDHRVDLVSGYTYNKLKDSTTLVSTTTDQFTGNLIQDGTVFRSNDLFETENNFHGAHLGMLSSVIHKRLTLSTLAKVSFGSMNQSASVRGFTTQELNGVSNTFPGGILTQQSNITEFSRNTFAFIPEMKVKMGYSLSDCIQMSVGYSFMYWSSVGLSGNQIDRTVDFSQALGGAPSARPAFSFADSGYWMHGVDVGLSMTY